MSFLGLCEGDPLVKTLTEVFNANIVRVPEENIQPLCVIARKKSKSFFRGTLAPLLVGNTALSISPTPSRMADVSGKRSRKVSWDLGFQVLEGFLKGFGIPTAEIALQLKGASEVSFTFKDVVRNFIDIDLLGKTLTGQTIDKEDPAASIFFKNGDYSFLVIDSIITSSDFAISVDKTSDQSFKLDIPTIQSIVSNVKVGVQVTTTTGRDLVFRGNKHLTFAFSCVKIYLDDSGFITSMPPADKVGSLDMSLEDINPPALDEIFYSPKRVMLSKKAGLLSWDLLSE